MQGRGRLAVAGVLGALALGAMAGPAHAAIWTEIPSNTTEDITAIEYRGGDQFWYATAGGKIYQRVGGTFVQRHTAPGVVFRDLEFTADGTIGLAVGTNGHLARSTNGGVSWGSVALPNGRDPASELNCGGSFPAGDLDSVRLDGLGRAWIAGQGSQIWRSTGTGAAGTWIDANNSGGAACKLVARDIDAMVFIPGSPAGYFIARSFGQVFYSSDPATTSAAEKPGRAGNGFQFLRRAAADPANLNRMWTVVPGSSGGGTSYVERTIDGWSTASGWNVVNRDLRDFTHAHDIDYAGGTVLAAGDAGMVVQSVDGENFFFNDATGIIATQNWRSVSLADGANGVIGGTNGKLAVTTQANVTPDVEKPTGTISGPGTAAAGAPVAFTLNAADTGGSGLNPASYAWTSAGLPNQAGNPATFTFPSPGFYTVRVTFADNAGNTAEATASISITRPSGTQPNTTIQLPGNAATAKIVGNRVRIRARGTVVLPRGASCSGRVKLTVKRKRTTLAKRTAKLKRKSGKCRFGKTIYIKRSKVGRTTTRLRLKVAITRNPALRAAPLTKTLVIKK